MIKDMIDKQIIELKKLWGNKRQLLFQLLNLEISCLSKHDSILIKESDYLIVNKIIKDCLDLFFGDGNYNLKSEKY